MAVGTETNLAELYSEVRNFYGRHMQLLDAGDPEGWANTFTEDGSFAPPSLPEPVRGRENLIAGLRKSAADLAENGEVHRHCMLMTTVTPRGDGTIVATSYTQIISTARGGEPRLHLMCVCRDILVREDGELKVRERVVTRDDRP
ncbi:hydroxylacyl-CoA dehydrogenase [Prauserella marina]|uniref:SnoaL-like domain-containing protein n=1 Tax=Prauserella marina TaxID=530584 RepID=A0A222VLW7_9PSEU|nr:nuclear transport factor 2 family protein [Prauserella marina]ASR34884.1 hydroxylacyl-CoA dehydrogenase [Prauserella marina]PWV85414.1 SnoaL-like protein [Prauserella marina]SDC55397.1 SnoaL-like domain-containing protein [Prauserella marina]